MRIAYADLMRAAAQLLITEADALGPLLRTADREAFDAGTVCDGWSVRDVIAHCAAALTMAASGDVHRFTPEDNQNDVAVRRRWPLADVLDELSTGYEAAAAAIDAAGGLLDGIGVGEWMHGGDIRDAWGIADAYASPGVADALDLLVLRSRAQRRLRLEVWLPDRVLEFGVGDPAGTVATDAATFVRLCGGRRPDPSEYQLTGSVAAMDLILFS